MFSNESPQFAADSFSHAKKVWSGAFSSKRKKRQTAAHSSKPFSAGRDPLNIGSILAATSGDMGWSEQLEQARLISDWPHLVGEATAPHTQVLSLSEGMLTVQCDSTAWATQLRRMRAEILTHILNDYPDAGVSDIRFLAPGAPSWRHGKRVAQGRGPRDTYG